MIRAFAFTVLFLTASVASAQPADPIFLQRAIASVQAQRNAALDAAAVAEAKAAGLADDLAKAQARIKDLEPKPDAPPAR